MQAHTEKFTIRKYELGTDHRLRVQALCNYMEEAATTHAELLGCGLNAMLARELTWVLAKMRLRFHAFPRAGEQLTVETWPAGGERLQFRRDFLFHTTVPIAAGVTQWVVMGTASRRIERMPEDIAVALPATSRRALESGDIRVPAITKSGAPNQSVAGPSFQVRLADIDQNRHVNNVRYVDFIQQAAHEFGLPAPSLAGLDIVFRAESVLGDTINSLTQPDPETPLSLIHSLHRNGQEIVRARTLWT